MFSEDTSVEAARAQQAAYRRAGREGRLEMALQLSVLSRSCSKAGIRKRHPAYDDETVEQALRGLVLGSDLYCAAMGKLPPRP